MNIRDILISRKEYNGEKVVIKILSFIKISFYLSKKIYDKYLYISKFLKYNNIKKTDELIKDFSKKKLSMYVSHNTIIKDKKKLQDILDKVDLRILKTFDKNLKEFQLQELNFAKEILNDIYENTDIKPFANFGTLLGAIRHKGFIPWDDDMDFGLIRNDYDNLCLYLKSKYRYIDTTKWIPNDNFFANKIKELLTKYPNEIFCLKRVCSFKVFKGNLDNYSFIDFFSFDYYNDIHNINTVMKYALKLRNLICNAKTANEIFEYQKLELLKNIDIVKTSNTILPGIDSVGLAWFNLGCILRPDDIFPLQKVKFENMSLYAPANPNNVLRMYYNNYNTVTIDNIAIANHQYTNIKKY